MVLVLCALTKFTSRAYFELDNNPVIAITQENAARSADELATDKSPCIGEPPPGYVIRVGPDWRNTRAAFPESEPLDASSDTPEKIERVNESTAMNSFAAAPDNARFKSPSRENQDRNGHLETV